MEEIWKDVVGYEGYYEVSNFGNVRRTSTNLKPGRNNKHGYLNVSLSKNGKSNSKSIHRLVAEAFISNPDNLPQINHKDCIKTNNFSINLEWCTLEDNIQHAVDNNRYRDQNGENNNMNKITIEDVHFIRKLLSEGYTAYQIHKEFYPYLHQQTIYAIKTKRIWKNI